MRIGVDARISYYNNSGLSRYLHGLVRALAAQPHDDTLVFLQNWRQRAPILAHDRVQIHRIITPPHASWERFALPLEARARTMDIFHCIDFYAPLKTHIPLVFTAQDLYFLHCPESMSANSLRFYKRFVAWVHRAAHVICSSISTQRDLLEQTGIAPERTSVVYPGIETTGTPVDTELCKRLTAELGLTTPPILMVGTIEPRKNIPTALEAYRRLRSRLGRDCPALLLVGRNGYQANELLGHSLPTGVSLLGEVEEITLRALYSMASILLYPSLYEGFGFPILEGFASDTAVITSHCSSMEEVAGAAAALIEPTDPQSIADAAERLIIDPTYHRQLVDRGHARLTDFNWRTSATQVRALYSSITGLP